MVHSRPLAFDLFAGLHGWGSALAAEGWRVIAFDLEDMCGKFGLPRPDNVQLVLQDVLTLHGSQFRDADLIVASPPCQEYSYMAMPWSRAKAIAAEYRSGVRDVSKLTALFDACFRIQREASDAAGRHIPMVVENVRGAIPWVGRSRWNHGSFHLWGDVPALMPMTKAAKIKGQGRNRYKATGEVSPHWRMEAVKVPALDGGRRTDSGKGARFTSRDCGIEGVKFHASGRDWFDLGPAAHGSKSQGRKRASAMIAKIPAQLARHIARVFKP